MKKTTWSRWQLLWGIAGIFLTACSQNTISTNIPMSEPTATVAVLNAGIHQQIFTDKNGGLFRYTIAIPEGYDGNQPVPLILGLHYGGTVTPFYSAGFLEGIEPSLRDLGAIIVAPDATAGQWTNERAETAIFALLDYIEANYNVDKDRTLVTGYSMGGMGTWYIAGRHQDYFKAALPMAGRPQANVSEIDWQIPLYIIHGRQDNVVPLPPTETAVEKLQAQGADVTLVILDSADHYDTRSFDTALEEATSWIRQKWGE
jgi:predicted peptidase